MDGGNANEDNGEEPHSFCKKRTHKFKNAVLASTSFLKEMGTKVKTSLFRTRPQSPTRRTFRAIDDMERVLADIPEVTESMRTMTESELYSWDTSHITTRIALSPADKEILDNNVRVMIKEGWEEMIRKAEKLTRKKDFLHLVLSYPMKPESVDDVDFQLLRGLFSCMNQRVRKLRALLLVNLYDKTGDEIGEAVKEGIEEQDFRAVVNILSRYDFHMVAYLPQEADTISDESWSRRIEVGLSSQISGAYEAPDEILTMGIDSAIRQVSKCIEYGSSRKIGISGSGGEKVAKALKDNPLVRAKGGVVLCISILPHHSIKEVEQNIAAQIHGIQVPDGPFGGSIHQLLDRSLFLLMDCGDGQLDLHELEIPGIVVLTTSLQNVYRIMDVDLEIKMADHQLPWELFCSNVGSPLVNSSSAIREKAVRLVKECHGHLLAIILLARALKGVTEIGMWEMALHELTSSSSGQVQGMSEVMVHALNFIWDRKDIRTKYCIKHFLLMMDKQRCDSLVSGWILNGLVESDVEAKDTLEDLINSFLVENVGEGHVRMREETAIVLQKCFIPYLPSLYQRQGGLGLTETPSEVKTWDALEIYLMDNLLSELPENPNCPALKLLWLNNNYELMEIPELFFQGMPLLQTLDLSCTSISSLPPSISGLVSLRTFNLRGCELIMELPPEIGALEELEVFDLEGTEIMYLPREIGKLTNLKCLRVALCGRANRHRVTKQMGTTIPKNLLSKLVQLVALSIDVNPDGEWWEADVNAILNELGSLKWLKILELYLPSVELLQQLRWDSGKLMYPDLLRFRLTVGHHPHRIISRLPHEVEEEFKKWQKSKKCLKYINGEGTPTEISEALHHASIFYLDRHWAVEMLTQFGNQNMGKLEFCLLVECNELQTVIDGDYTYPGDVDKKPVFGQLHYLGIHYMKNLQKIWKGAIDEGCLSNLTTLTLHTCPNLTTILTPDLVGNLDKLEELVVEDCPKIKSLISQDSSVLKPSQFLPSLKKISVLDLPELVSISRGLSIGPILESLIVYNCPKLENLYTMEVSSVNLKIRGQEKWWDSLKWHEPEWSSITRPAFEELKKGEDLIAQFAKDVYSQDF